MSEKIKDLIACLRDLDGNHRNYWSPEAARATNAKAEKAFKHIFETGRLKLNYSETDKLCLGYLLTIAINPLKINVERSACVYKTRLDTAILVKRSAVQFLFDSFGEFPVGRDNLLDVLESHKVRETVSILDKIIRDFRDVSDSDEGSDVILPPDVPASHTWWSS